MPHINFYSFGRMEIDSSTYTRDVIILPDGKIISPWWRKDGHILIKEDIKELLETKPDIIIAGTGASGLMKPSSALQEFLQINSIEFIARPTDKAVLLYNEMVQTKKTGACFHLTC